MIQILQSKYPYVETIIIIFNAQEKRKKKEN